MVNFADVRFWSKWLDDIADRQTPEGQVSYLAPPNWGEACYEDWPCGECSYSLFVWFVCQYYDDTRVLERHYDGITAGSPDGDYITFDVGSGRYAFEVSARPH